MAEPVVLSLTFWPWSNGLAWGILADWKGALAMYWGREYWEIFLIAVVVVIVFGVIQVSLGLADREDHRAGRWISDLLSRAIIGALCALLLDLLASWIAPKYWGPRQRRCPRLKVFQRKRRSRLSVPAPSERLHSGLACCRISVSRSVLVIPVSQRPHPGCPYRRCGRHKNAPDDHSVSPDDVVIVIAFSTGATLELFAVGCRSSSPNPPPPPASPQRRPDSST